MYGDFNLGAGFDEGDTVGIELNAKDQNISFYVNGINHGMAYKQIPKEKNLWLLLCGTKVIVFKLLILFKHMSHK